MQDGKDIRFGDWTQHDVNWLNTVNVRRAGSKCGAGSRCWGDACNGVQPSEPRPVSVLVPADARRAGQKRGQGARDWRSLAAVRFLGPRRQREAGCAAGLWAIVKASCCSRLPQLLCVLPNRLQFLTAKPAVYLVDRGRHLSHCLQASKPLPACHLLPQFLTAKPVVYLVNLSERDYQRKKNKWLPKIFEWVKVRFRRK